MANFDDDHVWGRESDGAPTRMTTLLKMGTSLIPIVGSPLLVFAEDRRTRMLRSSDRDFTAAFAEIPVEKITERLDADPEMNAMFVNSVRAAAATGFDVKSQALAKVMRAAFDDAKVDEHALMIAALAELEGPHIRALVRIEAAEDRVRKLGRTESLAQMMAAEVAQTAHDELEPVKAILIRTGVVVANGSFLGGESQIFKVSDFGRLMLKHLRSVGLDDDEA